MTDEKSVRVDASDFFAGFFAALAAQGCNTISIRGNRFDKALESVFQKLRDRAASERLDIRFRIRAHPVHGDSSTVRDSIAQAAQRELISLDNPEYQNIRLKMTPDDAEEFLKKLPLRRELLLELVADFQEHYSLAS